MIIGSGFSQKNRDLLEEIARKSEGSLSRKIPVKKVNKKFGYSRTEIKHMLEYLEGLGMVSLKTIGGPLLYGHVTITRKGLDKVEDLSKEN